MDEQAKPVFLARATYRRRRLADVAALMPVLASVLLMLPALWAENSRTAAAMIYVFSVWALLIFAMALISRRLGRAPIEETTDDQER